MSLRQEVEALRWFHEIDLGEGLITPGVCALASLQGLADLYFPRSLAGKTVLDIGCWDGFNSFEAHRRGAARVLATDHFAWNPPCWGMRQAFELARTQLAPQVEGRDIDLEDLSPASVGTFDIVLLAGVLYHLRHPLRALEVVAPLAKETLIVETVLDAPEIDRPAMIFYPGTELAGDPTNWWGPNIPCILAWLRDLGFAEISHITHSLYPGVSRGVFHARRSSVPV
ncbi:MAG TPA: DUF1698 domain-containing protein [Bryobacteraceae bacterium]|jgi:tRNA (mo5U34)-methyltransferase